LTYPLPADQKRIARLIKPTGPHHLGPNISPGETAHRLETHPKPAAAGGYDARFPEDMAVFMWFDNQRPTRPKEWFAQAADVNGYVLQLFL